jgi:hypothetical protein
VAKTFRFARLTAAGDVIGPQIRRNARSGAPADEWTPSRIRKMVEQSPPAMRDILTALASHPGEWMTSETLAKAIRGKDADWNTVAGTLGAFGRRLKSRYGMDSHPYEGRHEHGVGKVLRMSSQMAQQILQAMKNND